MKIFDEQYSDDLELPTALIEECISISENLGEKLYRKINTLKGLKDGIKRKLKEHKLLKNTNYLIYQSLPTTCGVDGGYVIDRLLSVDLVYCASLAIEGLTPPSEVRHWEKPHHRVFMDLILHHEKTTAQIRGLMHYFELELANSAPHEIVFIDGSLTTPLIHVNQAINSLHNYDKKSSLSQIIISKFEKFLENYLSILSSKRSDKIWAGIPKYTVRSEIRNYLGLQVDLDDRALLTLVLEPGEFVGPLKLQPPNSPWHLKLPYESHELKKSVDELIDAINTIHVVYFRPHKYTPSLRIEITSHVAQNDALLSKLFHGITYQTGTLKIQEPYPLYLADRMVKSLNKINFISKQIFMNKLVKEPEEDIIEYILSVNSYRSEGGTN